MFNDSLCPRIAAKIKELETIGQGTSKDALFLRKVELRLRLRKPLSDKQRQWTMNIMSKALPTFNLELIGRLNQLIENPKVNEGAKDLLGSFKSQVSKGNVLSPKQRAVIHSVEVQLSKHLAVLDSRAKARLDIVSQFVKLHPLPYNDRQARRLERIAMEWGARCSIYADDYSFICETYAEKFKTVESFDIDPGQQAIRHTIKPVSLHAGVLEKTPCLVVGSPVFERSRYGGPATFYVEILDHTGAVSKVPMHELHRQ